MGLRIGVNAVYLIPGRVGGTEIYLRTLLQALRRNVSESNPDTSFLIFRNRETGSDLVPAGPAFIDCPQPVSGENRPARILYEQLRLPRVLSGARADVVFNAGFTAPLLWRGPQVTVFHDLQYKHHPENFRRFDLPFWRLLLPVSARRSQRLVVLSESVKRDLTHFYGIRPARISVIPHGVEPAFEEIRLRRAAVRSRSRSLLTVSTLHPHKNLDRLLHAFRRFSQTHPEYRLTLVGLKGFESARIEALRTQLGLQTSVDIAGWVPRDRLYEYFAEADALIYASRFEGFGIPVLEALAAGLPVACSRLPSLLEIAGPDAARFFEPDEEDDLLAAMEEITGDENLRARLVAAGAVAAAKFDWRNSASRLLALLEEVAGSHKPATLSKNSHE